MKNLLNEHRMVISVWVVCRHSQLAGWALWLPVTALHHRELLTQEKTHIKNLKCSFYLNAYCFCIFVKLKNLKLGIICIQMGESPTWRSSGHFYWSVGPRNQIIWVISVHSNIVSEQTLTKGSKRLFVNIFIQLRVDKLFLSQYSWKQEHPLPWFSCINTNYILLWFFCSWSSLLIALYNIWLKMCSSLLSKSAMRIYISYE